MSHFKVRPRGAARDLPPRFVAFCAERGLRDMPCSDETLAAFLRAQTHLRRDSLSYWRSAVGRAHVDRGFDPPTKGPCVAQAIASTPAGRTGVDVTPRHVARIVDRFDPRVPLDARDAALTVMRFALGYTVEDLRRLRIEDVDFGGSGLRVRDVLHAGDDGTALARWLREWLAHLGASSGPLFRGWTTKGAWTTDALARRVIFRQTRTAALRAGLFPTADGRLRQMALRSVCTLESKRSSRCTT